MARAGYCKHGLPIDKDRECLYCKSERLDREYKTKAFEDNIRRIVREELAKLTTTPETRSDAPTEGWE